jgi:hypothetical protein
VDRGDLESALLGSAPVPSAPVPENAAQLKAYRGLTPEQCAALAANASNPANLYQLEALAAPERLHRSSRTRSVRQTILQCVAQEARNRATGAALEIYYDLAKAEAGDDLLARELSMVRDAVRRTEEILKGKLRPAVELDVWQRQQYTLQSDQVQARNRIEQLNGRLRGLLGISGSPNSTYYWPQIDAAELPEITDVEGAVAVALGLRPELHLLRCLIRDLDAESLIAIRPLLQTVSPLLGNDPEADHPCLIILRQMTATGPVREREVTVRRQQLEEWVGERERAVAGEARQAAHDVNAHRRLAELARRRAKSWQEKVDDLERRAAKGLASFADVSTARLEWLKARGEVVSELVAVRVADVRLKQAQSAWGHDGGGPALPPTPMLLPDIILPSPTGS